MFIVVNGKIWDEMTDENGRLFHSGDKQSIVFSEAAKSLFRRVFEEVYKNKKVTYLTTCSAEANYRYFLTLSLISIPSRFASS